MWGTPEKGSCCGKRAVTVGVGGQKGKQLLHSSFMVEGRDRCVWDGGGKGCVWHLLPGDPKKWEFI